MICLGTRRVAVGMSNLRLREVAIGSHLVNKIYLLKKGGVW